MARIAGVDLPNKHVNIALTYVYGIGRSSANKICEATNVDPHAHLNDLSEDDLTKLRKYIDENFKTEGRLRSEIGLNINVLWILEAIVDFVTVRVFLAAVSAHAPISYAQR